MARQLSRSGRDSSIRAYQTKWKGYRWWCCDRKHVVANTSISKISDFLSWLWESKGLSLPTIKAYRFMLSAVFKFKIPSLVQDLIIGELLRSFAVQRSRTSQSFPYWDLNKVLTYLMSDAFEPLQDKDLRYITMKVLFLVSLATAKRVG